MREWICTALLSACSIAIVIGPSRADAQPISTNDSVAIYEAALSLLSPPRFPPQRQVRWLDVRFLSPNEEKIDRIPPALLEEILMTSVGERFEILPEDMQSELRAGGMVRMAVLRMISRDTAAVDAQYIHRTRYHTGPATKMTLYIIRKGSRWRLLPQ